MRFAFRGWRRCLARRAVVSAVTSLVGVVVAVLTNVVPQSWNGWLLASLAGLTAFLMFAQNLPAASGGGSAVGASHGHLVPPLGTSLFVGRTRELAMLSRRVRRFDRSGPAVFVINGMPGVGKTELAIRTWIRLADRYPDGRLWLRMRAYAPAEAQVRREEALCLALNALGVRPDPSDLAGQWLAATTGKRMLLVLDDVSCAAQVRSLLPASNRSVVLVTSRNPLVGLDPDRRLRLDVFAGAEAREFAETILDRAGVDDRAGADAVAARYRLPLAVRHVCDLLAADPGADLSHLWTRPTGPGDWRDAFDVSLNALSPAGRGLLLWATRFPGTRITADLAAALLDVKPEQAQVHLAEIYQHGLLIAERGQGYRMHDEVRAAAGRHAPAGAAAAQVDERVLRHVGNRLARAAAVVYPTGPGPYSPFADNSAGPVSLAAARAWLDSSVPDLLATARYGLNQRWRGAWWLCLNLEFHLRTQGFYRDARALMTAAKDLTRQQGDQLGHAVVTNVLGVLDFRVGRYSQARQLLTDALTSFTALHHRHGVSEVHYELGKLNRFLGDHVAAREHQQQALSLKSETASSALVELGTLDRLTGRPASARAHLDRAMMLSTRMQDRPRQASAHRELGALLTLTGQWSQARTHLQAALAIYADYGDRHFQAVIRQHLGTLDRHERHFTRARQHLDAALAVHEAFGDRHNQANTHRQLALLAEARGAHRTARTHWTSAAGAYQALGLHSPPPTPEPDIHQQPAR